MKLFEYIREEGIQVSKFAARLGIALPTLYGIMKGMDTKLSTALRIEEITHGHVKIKDLTPTVFRPKKEKRQKEDCEKA